MTMPENEKIKETAAEQETPDAEKAETESKNAAAEESLKAEDKADTPDAGEKADEKNSHGDKKKVKKLEARIAELEKKLSGADGQIKGTEDKYLRLAAEYDNYRRRTQKEKDTIYSDAYGDALKQLLPVIDNLELAAKQTGSDAAAILAGVEMTLKTATETLAKLGIEAFGAVGEDFDPNKHTAVFHVEDESLGENVIAEVLQRGYSKGDKIIRYAVVKVAN